MSPNVKAFLSTIAYSEGTKDLGDDGYNVVVGSKPLQQILFSSYADHPRITVLVRRDNPQTAQDESILSTAAGRYQILARFFDAYRLPLKLKDFGKEAQDSIACQMIRECNAMDYVAAGMLEKAITLCKSRWASLPGSGAGQHENTFAYLRTAFNSYGGILG